MVSTQVFLDACIEHKQALLQVLNSKLKFTRLDGEAEEVLHHYIDYVLLKPATRLPKYDYGLEPWLKTAVIRHLNSRIWPQSNRYARAHVSLFDKDDQPRELAISTGLTYCDDILKASKEFRIQNAVGQALLEVKDDETRVLFLHYWNAQGLLLKPVVQKYIGSPVYCTVLEHKLKRGNYPENLSMEMVARLAGVSRQTMCKRFKPLEEAMVAGFQQAQLGVNAVMTKPTAKKVKVKNTTQLNGVVQSVTPTLEHLTRLQSLRKGKI